MTITFLFTYNNNKKTYITKIDVFDGKNNKDYQHILFKEIMNISEKVGVARTLYSIIA